MNKQLEQFPPRKIINSLAPIRICDNGGWTDTWFAKYGKVFNIAVSPYAEVQMAVYRAEDVEDRIVICAENYGDSYVWHSGSKEWYRHPLLEAAIERLGVPKDVAIRVHVFCQAPSGASVGTSAAVSVALVGALERLNGRQISPYPVAYVAQSLETEMLKQQCGIQDQLCSAFGGINFIEITSYPQAIVTPLEISDELWWEIERRLVLIYLGAAHRSSDVHDKVIRTLQEIGPTARVLQLLRSTAQAARDALLAGDLVAFGETMVSNTEAQRELHPDLVNEDADGVIGVAKRFNALGWKVNGAGGEGGSVTILCGRMGSDKRAMLKAIQEENPCYQNIPISISRYGLRVWEEQVC
ncbi:MAG: GHMP kinase [Chloroflexota bacterium]